MNKFVRLREVIMTENAIKFHLIYSSNESVDESTWERNVLEAKHQVEAKRLGGIDQGGGETSGLLHCAC